ncbi:MAG: MFS transporter [Dehalococcoidia bacterium]
MFAGFSQNNNDNGSGDQYLDSRLAAWFCTAMIAFSAGICCMFGILSNPLQDEFGWSRAATAGVFLIFLLVALLVVPMVLWAINKFGPRMMMLVFGIIIGLGLLLTSLSESTWQVYFNYSFLLGIGVGGTFSAAILILSKWFNRRQSMFLMIIGIGLGLIVVSPVCGWLVCSYDWKDACLILGIIAWLITIQPALFLKQPLREESIDKSIYTRTAVSSRNFQMIIFLLLFLSFSFHMITVNLIPHTVEAGISIRTASLLLSILGGVAVISAAITASMNNTADRKTLSIIFALIGAIAMFWVIEADAVWRFSVFAILFAPVIGGTLLYAFINTPEMWTGPEAKMRVLIVAMVWVIGGGGGAYLGAFLFDELGDYRFPFFLGAFAVIFVAALVWNLQVPEEEAAEPLAGATDDGTYSEL